MMMMMMMHMIIMLLRKRVVASRRVVVVVTAAVRALLLFRSLRSTCCAFASSLEESRVAKFRSIEPRARAHATIGRARARAVAAHLAPLRVWVLLVGVCGDGRRQQVCLSEIPKQVQQRSTLIDFVVVAVVVVSRWKQIQFSSPHLDLKGAVRRRGRH